MTSSFNIWSTLFIHNNFALIKHGSLPELYRWADQVHMLHHHCDCNKFEPCWSVIKRGAENEVLNCFFEIMKGNVFLFIPFSFLLIWSCILIGLVISCCLAGEPSDMVFCSLKLGISLLRGGNEMVQRVSFFASFKNIYFKCITKNKITHENFSFGSSWYIACILLRIIWISWNMHFLIQRFPKNIDLLYIVLSGSGLFPFVICPFLFTRKCWSIYRTRWMLVSSPALPSSWRNARKYTSSYYSNCDDNSGTENMYMDMDVLLIICRNWRCMYTNTKKIL